MKKLTGYLIPACLMLAGYASIGTVVADTSSMSALASEAAEKARECHRAAHDSRKAGQQDTRRADECGVACNMAYTLYERQQDKKRQQAQMERCTQLYNAYKSPDEFPVPEAVSPEITRMPSTIEEMVSRMLAMKSEKRQKYYPCAEGVRTINRRQLDLEQAKPYWENCVNRYKARMEVDMQAKRLYGR